MKKSVTIGIVQAAPVYLDAEKSLEKTLSLIEEAVKRGAELVVFGETWFTGYPAWIDHCPDATFCLEPQFKQEGIIIHTIENMEQILEERITLDTSGHYNRSDLFDFQVNNKRKQP
jgi:predicted amidohydrolase